MELPTGEARATTADDFSPHLDLGGSYSEAWSYVFLLDDGMQAHFSISRANLGSILGRVSGAEFAVTEFDGKSYRAPKQYGHEDFEYTPSRHRIAVSPRIYAQGSFANRHRVYFEANKDGSRFTLDAELTNIVPGLTWGDGVFHLGDNDFGVYIHIPYARVSGSITVDGVTKQIRGTAYMDHTFQTDFAPKLVRSAFRLVEHGPTPSVGFYVVPASQYEQRVVGLGAVKQGGRFRLQKPEAVEVISTRPKHGTQVPRQLAVYHAGGGRTIINRERDQQSFSVLEELGSIQKALANQYVGGEVVVFRGWGTTNRRARIAYDYLLVK